MLREGEAGEERDRQTEAVKQSAKHYHREGVTTASACVVKLFYINGWKASGRLTTSSPGCLSSVLLTAP